MLRNNILAKKYAMDFLENFYAILYILLIKRNILIIL
jgi:hypothetical protein